MPRARTMLPTRKPVAFATAAFVWAIVVVQGSVSASMCLPLSGLAKFSVMAVSGTGTGSSSVPSPTDCPSMSMKPTPPGSLTQPFSTLSASTTVTNGTRRAVSSNCVAHSGIKVWQVLLTITGHFCPGKSCVHRRLLADRDPWFVHHGELRPTARRQVVVGHCDTFVREVRTTRLVNSLRLHDNPTKLQSKGELFLPSRFRKAN